jgi:DNA-binding transcriptional LysR family regulator
VTNDGEAAVMMALRGFGILERSEWHVAPYIRSGQLQLLLPDWELPAADIYVVYPVKKNLSAKVRTFVDYLAERIANYEVVTDGVRNKW